MRILSLTWVLAASLGLSACAAPPPADGRPRDVVAVATTTPLGSVLADITSCAGATSATLMGPGDDPHSFSVASDQMAAMVRAKLVVANGLGLEEGLASALENVTRDGGRVFEVAGAVDPLPFGEEGHEGESAQEHAGHDHAGLDPHVWLDAGRMAEGAVAIGKELAEATGEARFADCGARVGGNLRAVDAEVRAVLAAVPAERRLLVTDHDAFGYFADAYGFQVAAVVVPGGSTDAEPSSADLADVVRVVRETRTPAVFANTAVNPTLVAAVSREAGVPVVELYVASVGPPGSGADTYAGMVTTNASRIADALT